MNLLLLHRTLLRIDMVSPLQNLRKAFYDDISALPPSRIMSTVSHQCREGGFNCWSYADHTD